MNNLNNNIFTKGIDLLRLKLPQSWEIKELPPKTQKFVDEKLIRIIGSNGESTDLICILKEHLDPKNALNLIESRKKLIRDLPLCLISPYLSSTVQEYLKSANISYLDLTNNIRIQLDSPGLYIENKGADHQPNRKDRPARTLKGAKAGRIVRTLLDFQNIVGIRELAQKAGVDAGYVSRVITFLENEAIVTRFTKVTVASLKLKARVGGLKSVDWMRLLQRWSIDAPIESRGRMLTCLEPRGLQLFLKQLSMSGLQHAVTGSLCASKWAPIASPRLAMVYVSNAHVAIQKLGLREVDTGSNVLLIEPDDDYVFLRSKQQEDVYYAGLSQVAADLLTSPGRSPSEGKELINWMKMNEDKWRG